MKVSKIKIIWVVLITVFSVLVGKVFEQSELGEFFENKTFDQRLALTNSNLAPDKDIVLVLVDEASLKSMKSIVGRWPWPRSIWAEVVDFLNSVEVKAIIFDIIFTEPQIARDESGTLGEDDLRLVEASASGKVFHGYQIIKDSIDEYNKNLLDRDMPGEFIQKFSIKRFKENTPSSNSFNNFYLPIEELYQYSYGVGVVEFSPDRDGVYRKTSLIRKYKKLFYPTLPFSYLLDHLRPHEITVQVDQLKLDQFLIPSIGDQYLINLKKNFNTFSASGVLATIQQILNGEDGPYVIDPSEFKDKIVLLAGSAVGIEDLKTTGLGELPGVYLHASIIENILTKSFIKKISFNRLILIYLIGAFIISFAGIYFKNIFLQHLFFPILAIAYGGISIYLFKLDYFWLPITSPVFIIFLGSYILTIIYMLFTEGRDKKFLKQAFGNYISPELIDKMHESGKAPALGGDVGIRTAYFTDIQGFSTFSEKLSATKLVELLNEYLSVMTDLLLDEEGTLDKYEGDAIIAFFGAPMELPDHASRAVLVAHQMQEALLELRKKWQSEGDKWPVIVHEMKMRIGVNSGEIVTGNMGSKKRMNYTMMGDAVNLAARLEEAAKQYGIFTHIAQNTKDLIDDDFFILRELDTIRVVGKSEPITTYDLLGIKSSINKNLLDLKNSFEKGLALYKNQQWDQAMEAFNESINYEHLRFSDLKDKTNPSEIYLKRCSDYKLNSPGEDWDGCFTLTSK